MATLRKLGRSTTRRKAMLRNPTTDVLTEGRTTTTVTRVKETRRLAEKMTTLGKRDDLHARHQALVYIYDEGVVTKPFEEAALKYANRNGEYIRILKMGSRRGDSAEVATIESV